MTHRPRPDVQAFGGVSRSGAAASSGSQFWTAEQAFETSTRHWKLKGKLVDAPAPNRDGEGLPIWAGKRSWETDLVDNSSGESSSDSDKVPQVVRNFSEAKRVQEWECAPARRGAQGRKAYGR